jgi:hypothetical protein
MLKCVGYVLKRAIAVRKNVASMIATTVNAVLSPVVVVPNLVVKWQQQHNSQAYIRL